MVGLRHLLSDPAVPDITVSNMTLDSRQVSAGDLFVALPGLHHDGRDFIEAAFTQGAAAVLTETVPEALLEDDRVIPIPRLKVRLGELANRFYRAPSKKLKLIAVTGTNGKTSIVELASQMLRSMGYRAGSIGTLGMKLVDRPSETRNTTPDCVSIHRQLAKWCDASVEWVAMEASSHALDQGRLDGLSIDAAVFSNLSRDHLDYHSSMEAYCEAKLRLFRDFAPAVRIFNADDALLTSHRNVWGKAGLGISCEGALADIQVLVKGAAPLALQLKTPWGATHIQSALAGRFNAFNLSAAVTLLAAMGLPFDAVISAAEQVDPVRGRLQKVEFESDIAVFIDYAHTPDALNRALCALSDFGVKGHIWVVFGCGGDRDRGKRAEMGATAAAIADRLVVTSDNPRSESPVAIIDDILEGCRHVVPMVEVDRAAAIALAVSQADTGDVVLIAGKGHETYQEVGSVRQPFCDSDHARKNLAIRRAA
ncbi:MAG: UDP-N-acetylmuramoyl-L-alanyl-D-glutamate--2,6-diaminopimelate ligase [Luminiphilus sp.]|jgi:UDP-N-acetylmuramyl-tripeptide synthetase|nr:UDP-N-acetylmuramoyl-L-alanyl-D-glutamate--2,6-diaminopimelate ligase [Luminiphilus sp.]